MSRVRSWVCSVAAIMGVLTLMLVGCDVLAIVPEPVPAATAASAEAGAPTTVAVTVPYVVDGDTIAVVMPDGSEERVRLIGVNTPEIGDEPELYGAEAAAYTTAELEGATVYLEIGVEERDRYGRLLAYVWMTAPVERSETLVQDTMFNAWLLLEGYAQVMTIPPNVEYADLFVECERTARDAQVGLWGLEREI